MRSTILKLSLILAVAFCCGVSAIGQTTTGDIDGTVTDASGALVVGATVTATNVATGVKTTTTTNKEGLYSLRFLQVGTYTVTISDKGFVTQKTAPFLLEVTQIAAVNAKLVAGAESTVQVSAQLEPILNTDNGTISTTVSETLINELPINGHNFTELAQFAPGVSVGDQNQFNGAAGSPNNSGERTQSLATLPNVNGNRTYNNNYFIDGIENTDEGANLANYAGAPIYDPAPEALQTVTVITTNPPAEYGNANGGWILTTLKSGSNGLHGSVYGNLQNYLMDANTFGNKRVLPGSAFAPRGQYTQTIFGATLGGPVVIPKLFNGKDKLFFFADYEGYRKPSGGTSTANVAQNAWRGNTTSTDSVDSSVSPLAGYAYFGNSISQQLYDTQNVTGNGYNAPFNKTVNGTTYRNLVPILNPVAKFLFANPQLYPLANEVGSGTIQNNYFGIVKALTQNDQFDIKGDYNITAQDRISVRYSYSNAHDGQTKILTPVALPNVNYFPYKGIGVNYVKTISPAVVNEFRFGFTRAHYNSLPYSGGSFGTNGDALVGIAFANQTVPGFTAQQFNQLGASSGGASTAGTSAGTNTAVDNNFEYGDNLTIVKGRNIIKVGLQIVRYQTNFFAGANYGGALGTQGYSGYFTGNPNSTALGYDFADFVLGDVTSLSVAQSTGDFGARQYRGAGFAQDDYKLTPTLTVNFGVRYQYTQPIYEVRNRLSNINLANGAVELAGINGNSNSLYQPVHNEFNPRFGFADQIKPRLVFRGGFAITTFMDYNALSHFGNAPFVAKVSLAAVDPSTTSPGTPFSTAAGFPTATGSNTSYTAWSNLKPQFVPQYTLATEYQLTNKSSLTIAYAGEIASRLLDIRNPNQWTKVGVATSAPYYSTIGSQAVTLLESEGAANFNSGEIMYRQRPMHGLELAINYTYSKALADTEGVTNVNDISGANQWPQDSTNIHGEYGPVGSDLRHQFNGTLEYALPFGRGKAFGTNVNRAIDEAIGGWKVSSSAVLLSGFPLSIRASSSSSGLDGSPAYVRARHYRKMKIVNRKYGYFEGLSPTNVPTFGNYATNEVIAGAFGTDPSATYSDHVGAGTCNNTALAQDDGICAYGIPQVLTSAATGGPLNFNDTVSNGTERAPAFRGFDANLLKDFPIYHDHLLQFQAKAYNAGNITSYNNPNIYVNGQGNWGVVQSTRSQQRQLELELKYKF